MRKFHADATPETARRRGLRRLRKTLCGLAGEELTVVGPERLAKYGRSACKRCTAKLAREDLKACEESFWKSLREESR